MSAVERFVLAVAAGFLLVGVIGWVAGSTAEKPANPLIVRAVEMGYFPCMWEDSPGPCYWDASERGNGQGNDFVVTDDGEVFYE